MPQPIKKELKVEATPPSEKKESPEKVEAKKEGPKKELPLWHFPLKQRSVRAKTLQEAVKIINSKE